MLNNIPYYHDYRMQTAFKVTLQELGGQGVGEIPWFQNLVILQMFEVILTPNFICKLESLLSNVLAN